MKEEKKEKIDAKDLKNETFKTVNELKDNVKNTNIKEETKATKGIIVEMIKDPLKKLKEIANNNNGKYLKTAIFLIIIWIILVFIKSTYNTVDSWGFSRVFNNILDILKDILAPLCGILIYSFIILIIGKKSTKPLSTIISTITITKIPIILSSLVSLLTIFSYNISLITLPFAKLCSIISIVLGYFAFKNLLDEEENKKFIKKYILIQVLYYAIYIIIGLLGIYV